MSNQNFTRPGAVDLSGLASKAEPGHSFVTTASEADFQDLATKSMRFPVLVEFYSPRDTQGANTSQALAKLVNAAGGAFLLARVDVDAEPRLAQSLGVQAVPMVVALIGGQMAPLFQGTKDEADIKAVLDQIQQVAVANGMTGRAEPVAASPATDGEQPPAQAADPRFDEADAALAAGDYARAVAEFDKLLADTPNDAEVIAGRAQAALLERSLRFEPQAMQAAAQNTNDIDAQLAMADLEVINDDAEAAFERLLGAAQSADAEARESIRVRMLELFEVVGRTDPRVMKARRRLATLLF